MRSAPQERCLPNPASSLGCSRPFTVALDPLTSLISSPFKLTQTFISIHISSQQFRECNADPDTKAGYIQLNNSKPSTNTRSHHLPPPRRITMNSDLSTFHYPHRTSASSYRVPTPPRIVVPPPTLNADALPEITLNVFKESSLLSKFNYDQLVKQNALLEWSYERRREAQMILPYLYLGPLAAVKDETWLKREGITFVLGVRQKGAFQSRLLDSAMVKAGNLGIETGAVDVVDNQDLVRQFPLTAGRIHSHIVQSVRPTGEMGKVLVFCESGNERSAAFVAAYLMEMYEDVDYIKAMQLCQAQRFCVNFDDGLKRLLQSYWDILCARRQVALYQTASSTDAGSDGNGSTAVKGKRGLEREEHGDEEMDGLDQDDVERFGGRQFAPFVDQPL